jgi:hypothetical protein
MLQAQHAISNSLQQALQAQQETGKQLQLTMQFLTQLQQGACKYSPDTGTQLGDLRLQMERLQMERLQLAAGSAAAAAAGYANAAAPAAAGAAAELHMLSQERC